MIQAINGPAIVKRGPGDPEWFPEAVALYTGYWFGQKRLIAIAVIKGRRSLFILPPVPSPLCDMKLSLLEEQVLKLLLEKIGSRYMSACKVVDDLLEESLSDTLARLVEEGLLDCVSNGCD